MELIKLCLIGLLMASNTAGQGEEGLLNVLKEMIKSEVSKEMKIERKVIKEEILKEIQNDKEKNEGIRKDLESTRKGNYKSIFNFNLFPINILFHFLLTFIALIYFYGYYS